MKLLPLLMQHRKFAAQGLGTNFGDGYLMAHNRVFRNARQSALKLGYRLETGNNPAYEALPLLQLESLLKAKTLPSSDNVLALERLSPAQLEALTWEDLDGNLKKNVLFHEACHGVVRVFAERILGSLPVPGTLPSQRLFALRTLLEESCANACELLGAVDALDQAHRIFYEMNSYICHFEIRTHLRNAIDDLGVETVLKTLILSYLHANFLRQGFDDRHFPEMLRMAAEHPLRPEQIKTLRALGKTAFLLNERFRLQTTGFHLRLAGIKTPLKEIFDFDFLKLLREQEGIDKFLDETVACFGAGLNRA